MSTVLYVGGSKDGTRGFVPNGFTRIMRETVEREVFRCRAMLSILTSCK